MQKSKHMAKKRKPLVEDAYDRRYRNDPESRDLTTEEATLFEAARQAIGLLKKTFETWMVIGKAIQAARARADRIGGGKTFRRILEQQGLAKVVPAATATRLLQIMEHLPEVSSWHAGLTDQQQVAWASPSAVFKHCPVFKQPGASKPRPQPAIAKPENVAKVMEQQEVRIEELQEELENLREEYDELQETYEGEERINPSDDVAIIAAGIIDNCGDEKAAEVAHAILEDLELGPKPKKTSRRRSKATTATAE
jgi:hypothetical protein